MVVLAHIIVLTPIVNALIEGTYKSNVKQMIVAFTTLIAYLKIINVI